MVLREKSKNRVIGSHTDPLRHGSVLLLVSIYEDELDERDLELDLNLNAKGFEDDDKELEDDDD